MSYFHGVVMLNATFNNMLALLFSKQSSIYL